MKKILTVLALILALSTIPGTSTALNWEVVDTGVDASPNFLALGLNYDTHWYAAEFTVQNPGYVLTDIEAYIVGLSPETGSPFDVFIDITDDGGNVPSSTVRHSGSFSLANMGTGWDPQAAGSNADWHGINGVSWPVDPGSYWVLLRLNAPYMAAVARDAPSPLSNEAYSYDSGASWADVDGVGLSLRIDGTPASDPIPEPATLVLVGTGLVGLVGLGRRKEG